MAPGCPLGQLRGVMPPSPDRMWSQFYESPAKPQKPISHATSGLELVYDRGETARTTGEQEL